MHLNILGLLTSTVVHWGCRPKKTPVENVSPTEDYHPLRAIVDDAEPMTLNDMGQGAIVDGVYIDSTKLFSVSVPEDWSVVPGSQFGELRVIVQHSIYDYSVQIWKVNGTHYRPTVREDCVWSFVDKGLYTDWSMSRPTSVATCVSSEPTEDLIFLAMKHWKGDTWHLESHVPVDVLVEGERATRQLIQSIQWLDGESTQRTAD